jgi:hypothetical protein
MKVNKNIRVDIVVDLLNIMNRVVNIIRFFESTTFVGVINDKITSCAKKLNQSWSNYLHSCLLVFSISMIFDVLMRHLKEVLEPPTISRVHL